MSYNVDERYKSLFKTIRINISITCFNSALCGSVIWLLLGAYALPIYSGLLKFAMCIGDLYRCKLQRDIAEYSIEKLNRRYLQVQYIETTVAVLAYVLIAYDVHKGMVIMLFSTFLSSITRAYFISYSTKIDDVLTKSNVVNRTRYYASIDKIANIYSTAGNLGNSLIFLVSAKYNINAVIVYKILAVVYAVVKIIDLICSIIEANKIKQVLKD